MPRPGTIDVVIVDDHPLFRQGLRQAVEADSRFRLVGETDNGRAALESIKRLQPHVAVIDLNLPGMNGLEVAAALQSQKSGTHLVVLTMLTNTDVFEPVAELASSLRRQVGDLLFWPRRGNYAFIPANNL